MPERQSAHGRCWGFVDLLSRSLEVLFRAVLTSLYLALAMTESKEKKNPTASSKAKDDRSATDKIEYQVVVKLMTGFLSRASAQAQKATER